MLKHHKYVVAKTRNIGFPFISSYNAVCALITRGIKQNHSLLYLVSRDRSQDDSEVHCTVSQCQNSGR
ncbi:hypothetical protein NC652_013710 [Populus alba x Populus x berolinensis]|nr:hypothetical protein NC652_013710 [Populus alba x Populus x berolinensis]